MPLPQIFESQHVTPYVFYASPRTRCGVQVHLNNGSRIKPGMTNNQARDDEQSGPG